MNSPTQAPNKFIATLPETATQGDYIDYYIEAFNSQKTLVTSSGNALTPTRIFLTGECPEQATNPPKVNQPSKQATNPQTVNPPTKQTTNPPKVNQPTNEGDSLNDDIYDEIFAKKTPSASGNTARSQASSSPKTTTQPKTTDTKQTPPKNSNALQTTNELLNQSAQTQNTPNTHLSSSDDILSYPNFQFSVMLGTGVGITGDKTENCDGNAKCMSNGGSVNSISTGVSSLPLHLRASAIFNLPKHFQIGVYLRGQLHNIVKDTLTPNAKANVKIPEQYNIMVGFTARYLILWEQPYRLYVGLELGWGGANATVDMGRNFNNFKDIYLYKGPWHIAPEIGFLWNFHKNIGLAFELTIPIVFPERPSAFFDLSIGPYVQF